MTQCWALLPKSWKTSTYDNYLVVKNKLIICITIICIHDNFYVKLMLVTAEYLLYCNHLQWAMFLFFCAAELSYHYTVILPFLVSSFILILAFLASWKHQSDVCNLQQSCSYRSRKYHAHSLVEWYFLRPFNWSF